MAEHRQLDAELVKSQTLVKANKSACALACKMYIAL
jgi:hypothetical protein